MTPKETILELIATKPKHYVKIIKQTPELLKWVDENTLDTSDYMPRRVYSAIHQLSGICSRGSLMKFNRINSGYIGCGPAKVCECTREKLSAGSFAARANRSPEKQKEMNLKRQETMINKYGYAFSTQRPEIKEAVCKSRLDDTTLTILSNYEWLNEEYNVKKRSLVDIAQELNIHYSTVGEYCRKLGFSIRRTAKYSLTELKLLEHIKTLGVTYYHQEHENWQSGVELDIYCPDQQIAFEVNGLYWHSWHPKKATKKENAQKHYYKIPKSRAIGIELYQFTDHQIMTKNEIVQSMISTALGKNIIIHANDCTVDFVSIVEATDFMDNFHLDGNSTMCTKSIGLYYKEELLSVMQLKDNSDSDVVEILRYATINGFYVDGGCKKMVDFISTFASCALVEHKLEYGNGIDYLRSGFIKLRRKVPSYVWTDGDELFDPNDYRDQFDPTKTEKENMFDLGFRIFYNCGSIDYGIEFVK